MPRLSHTLVTLMLATAVAAVPYRLAVTAAGQPEFSSAAAAAKSGPGKDGDGAEDDHDDNDGSGSSGSGSSGSGSSGSGSGSSGSGSGQSSSGTSREDGAALYRPRGPIQRIEVSRSGVEIRYGDGAREEIANGVYELRDPNGRRVVRRHATGSDIARLKAMSSQVSIHSITRRQTRKSDVARASSSGGTTIIEYSNGWVEEISGGIYRLTDPFHRMVATRPATSKDRNRLKTLAR